MTDHQTSPAGVKALRTVAEAFCTANLRECCIELNEWRTKGMLRDGKLRELGELCEKYVGCHDGLKNAEAMVDFQACALIAAPTQPKAQANPALAALLYALEKCDDDSDAMQFLGYWSTGDFDIIRRNWAKVPEEVFIGADPLHPQTKLS